MEYTGRFRTLDSTDHGERVAVLEYTSTARVPYCECSRCGKPIIRRMYTVQSAETGVELEYLGSECIKRLR